MEYGAYRMPANDISSQIKNLMVEVDGGDPVSVSSHGTTLLRKS